jgi:hypothetical protein
MYQIDLRRQAYKDLEPISSDYARLIASHTAFCTILMTKPKS